MTEIDTGRDLDDGARPGRLHRAMSWSRRQIRWGSAPLLVLLLLVVYLLAQRSGEARRTRTVVERDVAGGCLFWGDLARAAATVKPVPAPGSLGRTLIADSYISYETHRCIPRFGPLPAPPDWLTADVTRARARVVRRGNEPQPSPVPAATRLFD